MKFRVVITVLTPMILVAGAFAQTRNVQKTPNLSKVEIQPLNVKPGLWETSRTYKSSGAPPIPADTLARLSPEQRARLEQRINANSAGNTNTVTDKHCVTKEDVEKADFGQGKGECTYNVETSTSTRAKGTYSCLVQGMNANGAIDITASDPEHITGSTHGTLGGGGHTMNVESSFTSRFLTPNCGTAN